MAIPKSGWLLDAVGQGGADGLIVVLTLELVLLPAKEKVGFWSEDHIFEHRASKTPPMTPKFCVTFFAITGDNTMSLIVELCPSFKPNEPNRPFLPIIWVWGFHQAYFGQRADLPLPLVLTFSKNVIYTVSDHPKQLIVVSVQSFKAESLK